MEPLIRFGTKYLHLTVCSQYLLRVRNRALLCSPLHHVTIGSPLRRAAVNWKCPLIPCSLHRSISYCRSDTHEKCPMNRRMCRVGLWTSGLVMQRSELRTNVNVSEEANQTSNCKLLGHWFGIYWVSRISQ